VEDPPASVLLFKYKRVPCHPNIGLPIREDVEVIVSCFDGYIVKYLHRVVMIEGDHIASLREGDEVDANCFSAVEWFLIPAS
jgi:hypothetical protein